MGGRDMDWRIGRNRSRTARPVQGGKYPSDHDAVGAVVEI